MGGCATSFLRVTESNLASFTGQRLLISGAGGFMASNLIARLAGVDCCIVRLQRPASTTPPKSLAPSRGELVQGDFTQRAFWEAALPGADVVFHFAAQTSVYSADQNPAADWQANVLPLLTLLETCRAHGHRPLILFAGTCTQFGLPEHTPVDEACPDRPVTIYDQHKLAAEAYLEHYVRNGWARGATLRLANIYGPGPVSGKPDRGILNLMMRRALKGEALTLFEGCGGLLRDYLCVTDAVAAFLAAAQHGEAVNGQHFVLASGEGHTLAQAFQLVAERAALLTGKLVPVTSAPAPAGLSRIEHRNFVGDSRRLQAATGWQPRTSLAAGIDRTLQFLRAELLSST